MRLLWTLAVILVIIDALWLLCYLRRLMDTLEDIRKDTRELIIKARRETDDSDQEREDI